MSKNQKLLDKYVDEILAKYSIPAIAACVVNKHGKEVIKSIAGVRKLPKEGTVIKNNTVLIGDQFNIGSVSKILVGYVASLMVQKGVFMHGWQTSIKDVFPELTLPAYQGAACPKIHKEYLNANIEMLMNHSTGMPGWPKLEPQNEWMSPENINPPGAIKRRFKFVCAAIQEKPLFEPIGSDASYTFGSIIISSMLERVLGKHFEAIMAEHVFKPMGLNAAGYDLLHSIGKVDGIWQHSYMKATKKTTPVDSTIFELYRTNGAAGEAHFSILNMIDFIKNNLPNCAENKNILSGANQLDYQYKGTSFSKNEKAHSRGGWAYFKSENSKFNDVWHNGDNGRSYSHLEINSMEGYGYAVMTNVSGDGRGSNAVDELLVKIRGIISGWDEKTHIKFEEGKFERVG